MAQDPGKLVRALLLGAAMVVASSACGGAAASVPGASAAVATATPTLSPVPTTGLDPVARGKVIFEKTAGGVGCAYCHGLDAKGGGPANVNAPNIRGATEQKFRAAAGGGAPLMTFIKLSDEEIEAVLTYIQYLDQQ